MTLFIPICKVDEAQRLVYGRLTQEVTDKSGEIFDYDSGKAAFTTWSDEASKASGGKSKGNLRAMHGPIAAGKFTDISFDDANKSVEGCAKVVDDAEWQKVLEGVYTGFSIGGGYAKRWPDKDKPGLMRFTPTLAEVSLVDSPCVPTATFEVIKADGTHELRKFHHINQEDTMTKATESTEGGAAAASTEPAEGTAAVTKTAEEIAAAEAAKAAPVVELVKDGKPVKPETGPVQRWLAKDGTPFESKREAEVKNIEIEAMEKAAPAFDALARANAALDKADGGEPAATPAPTPSPAPTPAPEPVAEKGAGGELKKGLWGIGYLADILSSIQGFQESTEFESMFEGDESAMPETIKAWLKQGVEILKAYVEEETSELFEGDDVEVEVLAMAAKMSGETCDALAKFVKSDKVREALGKAGSRHSKADKASLMSVHKSAMDHVDAIEKCFKSVGIMDNDSADKGTKSEKLHKVTEERNEAVAGKAALEKVIGTLTEKFGEFAKRIEHLEGQPMPSKGVLKAIAKEADAGGTGDGKPSAEKVNADIEKLAPRERANLLMKAALANPVAI